MSLKRKNNIKSIKKDLSKYTRFSRGIYTGKNFYYANEISEELDDAIKDVIEYSINHKISLKNVYLTTYNTSSDCDVLTSIYNVNALCCCNFTEKYSIYEIHHYLYPYAIKYLREQTTLEFVIALEIFKKNDK